MNVLLLFVGFAFGAIFGIVIEALMVIAGNSDKEPNWDEIKTNNEDINKDYFDDEE